MALVQIFTALCGISGVGALATGIAARRVIDGNSPDATTAAAVDPKVKTSNATQPTHPRHFNPLAGLKLNLNPKSAADLAPALAMLTGLYEEGKERIGKLNVREKDLKHKFEEKQA